MQFSDFRQMVMDHLNRSDLTTAQANLYIQRAQARIQRDIRFPAMEKTVVAVPDSNGYLSYIALPPDFLEAQRIEADGVFLKFITPERLLVEAIRADGIPCTTPPFPSYLTGRFPRYAARVQGQIRMIPYPSRYATLYYYAQLTTLINDTDTNALLDFSPELLLFGALSYLGDFFRMDETQTWEARFQGEKEAVRLLAQDADAGPAMAVSPAYGEGYS